MFNYVVPVDVALLSLLILSYIEINYKRDANKMTLNNVIPVY